MRIVRVKPDSDMIQFMDCQWMAHMSDCLFCKIINGDIPGDIVYEDADFLAFNDKFPKADTHVLIVPKRHIAQLDAMGEADIDLMGRLLHLVTKVAKQLKLEGFRTIVNNGALGGQEIFHLHFHLLANQGEKLPGF